MTGALLSIQPRFSRAIFAGTKTVELRRRGPSCQPGDIVVVYETAPTKAIVGFAVVKKIDVTSKTFLWKATKDCTTVSYSEYQDYFSGVSLAVGIYLSSVMPISKPISLEQAKRIAPLFRPPQSWCYLHSLPPALTAALIRSQRKGRGS